MNKQEAYRRGLIYNKECVVCGKEFKAVRKDHRYCSSYCKLVYHKLKNDMNALRQFDIKEFIKRANA